MTVRVLHVVEAIEGGIARHLVDVVRHVNAQHEVAVPPERVGGLTDLPALGALAEAGARIHSIRMRRSPAHPDNAVALARLRGIVRRVRPDVVHGHSAIGGALARLAAAGTPSARVYTAHGLLPSRAAMSGERALGHLTDRFVAVSPSEASLVDELRLVPGHKVAMIPNGIELSARVTTARSLREQMGAPRDAPIVGMVGRLARQKAPEVFLRACALTATRVPQAHFVLVGDGPLLREVEEEARRIGLGSRLLCLHGVTDAAALLDQFTVFVLSSRYEGAPYTPLEAMRAGVPVVLTDVTGNRDVVGGTASGVLVPPDDPVALAAAIEAILSDPALARSMVEASERRLSEVFDVRLMAERLQHTYVIAGRQRALRVKRR